MLNLKRYSHYFIIAGLAMLLIAIAQLGGGGAVWADNSNQTLPQPTSPSGGGGGGDGGGGGSASKIIGTVTDLSTGKAGTGVVVRINNDEVRTDSFGDYSLSGLAAGEYVVVLVLEGEAAPAQYPATVYLDGANEVALNLEYYSVPPSGGVEMKHITLGASPTPTPTVVVATATTSPAAATPQPEAVPAPVTLPETGASLDYGWQLLLGVGGLLLALGISFSVWVKVE